MTNYFFTTDTKDWRIKDAYEKLEEEMPSSPMSQLLYQLKTQLKEVLASETVDQEKASAALKLLQSWRNVKSNILKDDTNRNSTKSIDNNYGIASIGSSLNITINNTIEETPTTSKITYSEVNDGSMQPSWNSLHKTRKTKHLKIYLSTSYGETDFGEERHWTVNGINMTATFKEFREKSIKGAQLRKVLSDQRILSLSYIFLISRDSRLLSGFSSDEKALILKDMRLKRSWRPIEEEVTLVCHKIHKILQDDKISQDAATDIIDSIRAGCNSVDGKAATRIISSLMYRFMDWRENKASESSLIIEVMRPFVFECIIKPSKDIQFEWMTYRMLSSQDDCQLMIPDLAVYVDTVPNINFELLTIEVKKQGNCSNGSLEKDLVKLGKEMQLALNKLIIYKVQKPTVMGLLVEGLKMTAFRMDLEFDGQYRMLEIGQVFLVRDNKCDILLVPTIMQVLTQVKEEIEVTRTNLFKAIKGQGVTTDKKGYMRKSCSSPLVVDADGKGKNKEN